jgi:ribose 5-phosphate isomerase A
MSPAAGGQMPGERATLDRLAARALELVSGASLLGLGSGRAASAFIRALGATVRAGRQVRGVPTSEDSARLAREVGIPVVELGDAVLDVTVDGADEVDPNLDLIKGYGGALVRERIVAMASAQQVILVGSEKLAPVLGSHGRVPIEVVPFALPLALRKLREIPCDPRVRLRDGRPYVSDNGNIVVDCGVQPIADPPALHARMRSIPGVVDTGLFLGTAWAVLVGEADAVTVRRRGDARPRA